jgi:hypothetical protein
VNAVVPTPAAGTAVCCFHLCVTPMHNVASFVMGSAELRCGRSGYNLQLPLSTPTSNFRLNFFSQSGILDFLYVKISQSLMAVNVALCFGCFTASTAGRLDVPHCRCHFLYSTTNLPLDLASPSPSLEVCRLSYVYLS